LDNKVFDIIDARCNHEDVAVGSPKQIYSAFGRLLLVFV